MELSAVYKIDISKPLYPTPIQQMLICQDKEANRLTFELYNGETPFSPGGSCAGYAVRADGQTVPMTGTVAANVLSIVLPEEAYAIEGPVNIVVKSVAGGKRTSVFFGMGSILIGQTGTIVNPGDVIPDITELMAAIDQMEQATAAAEAAATKSVRYDTAQTLTGAQMAQARVNIQAAHYTDLAPVFSTSVSYSKDDYVIYDGNLMQFTADHPEGAWTGSDATSARVSSGMNKGAVVYDKTQSMTAAQKATARHNILAAGQNDLAPLFSVSGNYTAGQYVYYNDVLYRFTADHPAGAWTGTDAAVAVLGNDVTDLKGALDSLAVFPEKTLVLSGEQQINGPGTKTNPLTDLSSGDKYEITVERTLETNTSWDVLTAYNGSTKRIVPGSASGSDTITITLADDENGLTVRSKNQNTVGTIVDYTIKVYKIIREETALRPEVLPPIPEIDDTLTQEGEAADAKATGDRLDALDADIDTVDDRIDSVDAKTNELATFPENTLVASAQYAINGAGNRWTDVYDKQPGQQFEVNVTRTPAENTRWYIITVYRISESEMATRRTIQGSEAGLDTVTFTLASNENGFRIRVVNENATGVIANFDVSAYLIDSSETVLKKAVIPYVGSKMDLNKRIVWFGTSIPQGNMGSLSYPLVLGQKLGVTVYNEAIGSSRARASWAEFVTESNPLGAGSGYNSLIKAMGYTLTEKQYLIDNYDTLKASFTDTHPDSLSPELQLEIKNYSFERKLYRYLTGKQATYNTVDTTGFIGDVDIYVLDHGYNDISNRIYASDTTIPEPGASNEMYYYAGAMNRYIREIMENNLHAKIVIISHYANTEGKRDATVVEMQETIAAYWNIPIIKIYENIGWTDVEITVNGTTKTVRNAWLPDGLHPASDTSGKAVERYVQLLFPHFRDYIQEY